jgi:hypothetical protein
MVGFGQEIKREKNNINKTEKLLDKEMTIFHQLEHSLFLEIKEIKHLEHNVIKIKHQLKTLRNIVFHKEELITEIYSLSEVRNKENNEKICKLNKKLAKTNKATDGIFSHLYKKIEEIKPNQYSELLRSTKTNYEGLKELEENILKLKSQFRIISEQNISLMKHYNEINEKS